MNDPSPRLADKYGFRTKPMADVFPIGAVIWTPAESESIVPSGHKHQHPMAIAEVERVVKLHIQRETADF